MNQPRERIVIVMDDEPSTLNGLRRLGRSHAFIALGFSDQAELASWALDRMPLLADGTLCVCLVLQATVAVDLLKKQPWPRFTAYPILCISRDVTLLNRTQIALPGLFQYMEKPFTLEEIAGKLSNAFSVCGERVALYRERETICAHFDEMTPREREVCALVVQGLPNKKISETLGIAIKTVKVHRANVMRKTRTTSLIQLVRAHDLVHRSGENLS